MAEFVLALTKVWCGTYTPQSVRFSIAKGVHSISRFRVIGSVQNLPEFAEAFSCPVGTEMNPTHKCRVW